MNEYLSRAMTLSSSTALEDIGTIIANGFDRRGNPFPLVGAEFNHWTVTGAPFKKYSSGQSRTVMPVECSCGGTSAVTPSALRSGRSKRCDDCRLLDTPELMRKGKLS